jgi:putative mRNA 3-end processing factor
MSVSYQHANPYDGNESFLLRFEQEMGQTACVLVDADDLLDDDEHLTAILLTHAHSDHYQSLAANLRDGAHIYTTEATARALGSVLSEAEQYADDNFGETDAVLDALEPIDDWESPVEGLRIAPIPVGHTPGAAGFVLQFEGDDGRETILATGDWTRASVQRATPASTRPSRSTSARYSSRVRRTTPTASHSPSRSARSASAPTLGLRYW